MEEEFDKVYRTTAKELFWIAYALVKDKEVASDAVQEAFMMVWVNREKLLHSSYLYAYLIRSVKNYVLNYRRNELNRLKHEDDVARSISSELAVDEERYAARLELARKLVSELPERCREIFVKCVLEGMTYQECARKYQVSVTTVKYHIKEAYKRLRNEANDNPELLLLVVFLLLWTK